MELRKSRYGDDESREFSIKITALFQVTFTVLILFVKSLFKNNHAYEGMNDFLSSR
jgi:hypothetical protein